MSVESAVKKSPNNKKKKHNSSLIGIGGDVKLKVDGHVEFIESNKEINTNEHILNATYYMAIGGEISRSRVNLT